VDAFGVDLAPGMAELAGRPADLAGLLCEAGFALLAQATREPDPTEKTPQGALIVRKPAG